MAAGGQVFEIPEIVTIIAQCLSDVDRGRCIAINNVFFNQIRRLRYSTVSEEMFKHISLHAKSLTRLETYLTSTKHLAINVDDMTHLNRIILTHCEVLELHSSAVRGRMWETNGDTWPHLRVIELHMVFVPFGFLYPLVERFPGVEYNMYIKDPRDYDIFEIYNAVERRMCGFFASGAIWALPRLSVFIDDAQDPPICNRVFKAVGLRDNNIRHLHATFTENGGALMSNILTQFHDNAPYHDIKSFTCTRGIEHSKLLFHYMLNVEKLRLHIEREEVFKLVRDKLTKLVEFTATMDFEPTVNDIDLVRSRNPGLVSLCLNSKDQLGY